MKVFELCEEAAADVSSTLVQVLRTVIGSADQQGVSLFLHFDKPTANDIRTDSKNLDLK